MKSKQVFKEGDRVAECPKLRTFIASSPEGRDKVKAVSSQRFGTVLGMKYKTNVNGSRVPYVEVLWDGLSSSSLHSQHRICFVEQLEELVKDFSDGIGA